ncbi:hypothetical protein BC830DRAFT_1147349 [Chytriomyces sp. MP71]|nr:hypothetical protein BC830DRAFT_1147349 [Chytriomyces sp. MP71]
MDAASSAWTLASASTSDVSRAGEEPNRLKQCASEEYELERRATAANPASSLASMSSSDSLASLSLRLSLTERRRNSPTAKIDLEPLLAFQEQRRLSKVNRREKRLVSKDSLQQLDESYESDNLNSVDVGLPNPTYLDEETNICASLEALNVSVTPLSMNTKTSTDSLSSTRWTSYADFRETRHPVFHGKKHDSETESESSPSSINFVEQSFRDTTIDAVSESDASSSLPSTQSQAEATDETRDDFFYTNAKLAADRPPPKHAAAADQQDKRKADPPNNIARELSLMDDEQSSIDIPKSASKTNLESILSSRLVLEITSLSSAAFEGTLSTTNLQSMDGFDQQVAQLVLDGISRPASGDTTSIGTTASLSVDPSDFRGDDALEISTIVSDGAAELPSQQSELTSKSSLMFMPRQCPVKDTNSNAILETETLTPKLQHFLGSHECRESLLTSRPAEPSSQRHPLISATNSPTKMACTSSIPKRAHRTAPSLLRIKGKRKHHCHEVPLRASSLTQADVYILEMPLSAAASGFRAAGDAEELKAVLFVWCGGASGLVKRAKGKEIAYRIRERDWGTKAEILELVEGDEAEAMSRFRKLFPLESPSREEVSLSIEDDAEYERAMDASMILYGLNDLGTFDPIVLDGRHLSVKLLNSGSCFLLNCKGEKLYMWIGRGCNAEVKSAAESFAKNLLNTTVASVLQIERDLNESVLFMEKFQDWTNKVSIEVLAAKNIVIKDKTRAVFDRAGFKPAATAINVHAMMAPPRPLASWERQADGSTQLVDIGGPPPVEMDRGKLKLEAWMAVGSEMVVAPEAAQGLLYSSECYLFLYEHLMGRPGNEKVTHEAYFWIGDDTKKTEQGTIAYAAIELEKKHNARQIRVTQGHESDDFLQIFCSSYHATTPLDTHVVIRRGSHSTDTYIDKVLYCIGGYNEASVRGIQVDWNVASFNSGAVFLAITDRVGYLWVGDGAHGFEREAGVNVAKRLCDQKRIIQELCEPADFWVQFGVQRDQSPRDCYASVPYLLQKAKFTGTFKRRLWRVSHVVNGGATAEEIVPFTQRDLEQTSVYILDAFFEVFVWVGRLATPKFRDIQLALATALEYAVCVEKASLRSTRRSELCDGEMRVLVVEGNGEPKEFKSCFLAFDSKQLYVTDKVQVAKLHDAKSLLARIQHGAFTLQELQCKPMGIDPSNVERHLSRDDFYKLFQCDIATFDKYPTWKRLELKKKAGLF